MEWKSLLWRGMEAVALFNESARAVILPQMGANCVSYAHLESGQECLRTPPDREALAGDPNVYGLPLLFPPNRIRGGRFSFRGRTYAFPINEPARGCHIHGALSQAPFAHRGGGRFVFRAAEKGYLAFPHAFTVIREYSLDPAGALTHTVTFINESPAPLPLGTGIHAAWRAPAGEGLRLKMPALREWELDGDSRLPTGIIREDTPLLRALRQGKLDPDAQPLSALVQCEKGPVALAGPRGKWICQRDDYPFVMLWNGGGGQGFVCPEPQTWAIDAPNLDLPWEETGMRALSPGEEASFSLVFRFLPPEA